MIYDLWDRICWHLGHHTANTGPAVARSAGPVPPPMTRDGPMHDTNNIQMLIEYLCEEWDLHLHRSSVPHRTGLHSLRGVLGEDTQENVGWPALTPPGTYWGISDLHTHQTYLFTLDNFWRSLWVSLLNSYNGYNTWQECMMTSSLLRWCHHVLLHLVNWPMFQMIVLLSWVRVRAEEADTGTMFSTLSIGPLWQCSRTVTTITHLYSQQCYNWYCGESYACLEHAHNFCQIAVYA